MYHIFCIHSSVEEHLGSFQLLAIINKAAINIVEHVSLLQVGTSSGYMPRSGITVGKSLEDVWGIAGWFPVELRSEPPMVIFHLHDTVGVPSCSWNSGPCLRYHLPQPPQEKHGHSTRGSFIVENSFCYPRFSLFQINLQIALSNSVKNWAGILMGIALNL